ncbi:MAG: hypothetical protein ACU0AU_06870 [Cognatishimia activa]
MSAWQKIVERQSLFRFVSSLIAAFFVTLLFLIPLTSATFTTSREGNFVFTPDTISNLNAVLNVAVLLIPPFLFGMLGAVGRLLMSGGKISERIDGILGAGIIAMVAVLSLESGLIGVISRAYFEGQLSSAEAQSISTEVVNGTQSAHGEVLIAIVAGMFAYNLFTLMKKAAENASK